MSAPNTAVAILGTAPNCVPMPSRLASAGFRVTLWDACAEPRAGADAAAIAFARTPVEAVARADVILAAVGGDIDAAASVLPAAAIDATRPGCTCVLLGDGGASRTPELALRAAGRGLHVVEAIALGGARMARTGALVVFAAGPDAARGRVQPLFDVIARRTVWLALGRGRGDDSISERTAA